MAIFHQPGVLFVHDSFSVQSACCQMSFMMPASYEVFTQGRDVIPCLNPLPLFVLLHLKGHYPCLLAQVCYDPDVLSVTEPTVSMNWRKLEALTPAHLIIPHTRTAHWVTEASQSPVPACGTTFHQDYDGWDCPLTLLNNLLKLTCLATEAHSDSIEFVCAIQKTLMYVCVYSFVMHYDTHEGNYTAAFMPVLWCMYPRRRLVPK